MFPLGYLLIAWLVLLLINGIAVLITVVQGLKYAPSTAMPAFCFLFVAVVAIVVLGMGRYLLTVNWSTPVSILPSFLSSMFHTGAPNDLPLQ
jgi:hypothetical protein